MKTYLIVSEKSWHEILYKNLLENFTSCCWELVQKKENFNLEILNKLKPDKIFIPHWSYIIPSSIYEKFECIVFHMTDLPYGRGGSPLQNLIISGKKNTKISAIRVKKGIDTGPIYLKKSLSLQGTAKEIFLRSSPIIESMIKEIIQKDLKSIKQEGEITEFKRRKPEEGDLKDLIKIEQIYNHIRMLDCEGYPNAFLETENFRFEFSRASLKSEKEIIADVRIIKK